MHESILARSALPAPTVCLGMLLRPYSLGHELWLLRESNSLLRTSAFSLQPSALESLPAAVLICSQTWAELKAMRSDRLLGFKLWIWKRRIRNLQPATFNLQLQLFLAYRAEGLLEFPISQVTRADRGNARLPGTPFILRLQQWLMSQFHLSESAAWDYPVGLAKMRWAAHWESEGGLEVYNAHEAESDAQIAEWESQGGPSAIAERLGGTPEGRQARLGELAAGGKAKV